MMDEAAAPRIEPAGKLWTGRRACRARSRVSSTKPAWAARETRRSEPVLGRAKPDPWDAPGKGVDHERHANKTNPGDSAVRNAEVAT